MKPDQKFRRSAFILHVITLRAISRRLESSFILFFRRLPLAVWIGLAVIGAHLLFFWVVADKHFMPKASPYIPPPRPPNFGSATRRTLDPRTGDAVTETQFQVSTTFATPVRPPSPSPAASPG